MTAQLTRPVEAAEAAEAIQTLIRHVEQLEEIVRRNRMPEVRLTDEELRELDEAEREMNEGMSMNLDEFNQRLCAEIQRNSAP